ncbi:MAG: nucleotidyltransferase domain-containing protein [Fidelibacterota bacterium]
MNMIDLVKKEVNKISLDNEVILFGSRARGDFRKDSDWDFLILLKKKEVSKSEKEKIRERLYDLELATDEVISTIIHSQNEWENRSVTPIYKIIKEEGKRA